MRNGQNNNKRMRGRGNNNNNNNNRKGQNPLTRVYESNGPDVKIRGTANHIAEKYIQLARDAQSNGDPVAAENYYQHAEHYFRLIAAANEQFRQSQPFYQPGQSENRSDPFDDSDDDGQPAMGNEPGFVPREQPQPRENQAYSPREPQPYMQRDNQRDNSQRENGQRDNGQRFNGPRDNSHRERAPQNNQPQPDSGEIGLPSFITGGGAQPQAGANGQEGAEGQQDRFGMHRRRRRHRGPRADMAGAPEGGAEAPQGGAEE